MVDRGFTEPETLPRGYRKWGAADLFKLYLYFGGLFVALTALPNSLWDPELRQFTLLIGALGIWRYAWWSIHLARAKLYEKRIYPRLRAAASEVWVSGWRPGRIHFMMTTYKENRQVTEKVIASICRELRAAGARGTLWVGSGDAHDERIVEDFLGRTAGDLDLDVVMVRQNLPGKRMAIGLVLRAMSRRRIDPEDLVVFMDGDSILGPELLARCAPLFQVRHDLEALTTDEDVICYGPRWVQHWLALRCAQRRIAMQSHAVSDKVLTLTGRMSMFRARHLLSLEFVRLLEADYLDHWLRGRFRFLSGDDKSTWFYMLRHGAIMLYVPDALVHTIEFVEGTGVKRMAQNFRRWSGNMLRNGARAIALGPRRVGFFIWWCLLDQRIAMWTMLISPLLALLAAGLHGSDYLLSYVLWLLFSRMLLSLWLYHYARRVYLSFPFILYVNQLFNSVIKVYVLFRLSQQRWFNRGDQAAGFASGWRHALKGVMASYVTLFYVSLLVTVTAAYTGAVELPSFRIAADLLAVWN